MVIDAGHWRNAAAASESTATRGGHPSTRSTDHGRAHPGTAEQRTGAGSCVTATSGHRPRLSDARLSMRDMRELVHKALDELDLLGDRIANAVGIR